MKLGGCGQSIDNGVADGAVGFAVGFGVNFEFGFVGVDVLMEGWWIGMNFVFVIGKGCVREVHTDQIKDSKVGKSNSVGSAVS